MFSGIVEKKAKIKSLEKSGTNLIIEVENPFEEVYIDQSISHNGTCLTVVDISEDTYKVDAVQETLSKTNLGTLQVGDHINLERCMLPTTRMDGHIVQGHVDEIATLVSAQELDGSWSFKFKLGEESNLLVVPRGSICINGISLTVASIKDQMVEVAIIPYTYENTNLVNLKIGDPVNIEYDIMGKYVVNYMQKKNASQ